MSIAFKFLSDVSDEELIELRLQTAVDHMDEATFDEALLATQDESARRSPNRGGRPRLRVIGGTCMRGHLLNEKNAYRMPKRGSWYLRCAICESEKMQRHSRAVEV